MLGKLIKYELKSTARIFIPFYIAVIVLSLLNRVLFVMLNNVNFLGIARVLTMLAYVFIIIATFVMTFIVMVQRFYKSLLGDEGYLSMTLPVKVHTHMLSKFLVSVLWILSTLLVTFISIFVMLPDYSFLSKLGYYWNNISESFRQATSLSFGVLLIECLLVVFFALMTTIMMIYTAISIGHLSSKHKTASSFGAFLGLYMVVEVINLTLVSIFMTSTINWDMLDATLERSIQDSVNNGTNLVLPNMGLEAVPYFMLGVLLLQIVYGVAFFLISKYILKNKLNLE